MPRFNLIHSRQLVLATVLLTAAALAPNRADASLMGTSVFGCVATSNSCTPAGTENLFGTAGSTTIGAGSEFTGTGEVPANFSVTADLGTDSNDIDFISLTIVNTPGQFGAQPVAPLTWILSGLNWLNDPLGIITGVSEVTTGGPIANLLAFTETSVTVQTGLIPVPGTTNLLFQLTTGMGTEEEEEDDENTLPGPAPLLLLLIGLPLILLRRRMR